MRSLLGVRAHLRRDMGAARQLGVLGTPLMRESEDVAEGEGAVKRPRRELLRSSEEPRYGRSYLLLENPGLQPCLLLENPGLQPCLHLENPGLQPWPCDVFGHSHGVVVVMRRPVGPHWAQRAALKRRGCAGTLPQSALEGCHRRPGGQAVASSNLASPTISRWTITPDQSCVQPATSPCSTSLSAGESGPDWAHQRVCTPRQHRGRP
jgi:hypothetical protein